MNDDDLEQGICPSCGAKSPIMDFDILDFGGDDESYQCPKCGEIFEDFEVVDNE